MRDFRSAMRLELHRHHIEPNISALTRVSLDVTHGHALQGELFAPRDHLLGLPKLVLGLGFHFDEHQRGIIPGDNIDFARPQPEIARGNAIPQPLKERHGNPFARITLRAPQIRHGIPDAPRPREN